MTRHPRTCRPTDTVLECIRIMKEVDTGFVPVCDPSDGRVVGVITDRDICLAMFRDVKASSLRCSEVMSRDPVFCRPDDDVFAAARAMEDSRIRRIPVVDRDNTLLGIIAIADIVRRAVGRKDLESELRSVVQNVSAPGMG